MHHEHTTFLIHSSFYHYTRTRSTIGTTRSSPRTTRTSWLVGASAGGIERANQQGAKQCRTLRSQTKEVCAIHLDMYHKLIHWLIPRNMITDFQMKTEVENPYERLRNRAYNGKLVDVAETAHHRDPAKDTGKMDDKSHFGTWLGKIMVSDEHYIGASAGVNICKSIWGSAGKNARWVARTLDEFARTPWAPLQRSTRWGCCSVRDVYVTRDRQIKTCWYQGSDRPKYTAPRAVHASRRWHRRDLQPRWRRGLPPRRRPALLHGGQPRSSGGSKRGQCHGRDTPRCSCHRADARCGCGGRAFSQFLTIRGR